MDVLCYDDLDEFGRDIDDPLVELEQDIVHMLFEAYGSNCDAPDRSLALIQALSGPQNQGLRHFLETRLAEDPRIGAVEVSLTPTSGTDPRVRIRIDLRIQVNEAAFDMAVVVDPNGSVRRVTP